MARNLTTGLQRGLRRSVAGGLGAGDLFSTAALDLRFAQQKTLDPRITFTRASSGTYVDSQGVIRTATTNEPRFDHNPTTGESLGLLVEEQRTNLLTQSEFQSGWTTFNTATVVLNDAVSPDGLTKATRLNSSDPTDYIYQTPATVIGVTYTFSFFIKAGTSTRSHWHVRTSSTVAFGQINWSNGEITSLAVSTGSATFADTGNGWYKIAVVYTAVETNARHRIGAGDNTSTTGSAYIWGAQLEAGSFPTSYIPTTTATVTRSADVASITGSNFSSWYRQDEGSIYFESKTNQGASAYPYSLFGSSTFNRIYATYLSSARIQSGNRVASTFDPALNTLDNSAPIGFYGKGATSYKIGNFAFVWNGNNALTGSPSALASVLKLDIGNNGALSGNFLNGTIKRLTYFPARLANETLQRITQ